MKDRLIQLILIVVFLNTTVYGQNDKPDWLKTGGKPDSPNGKFIYIIGTGTANSVDTAKRSAFNNTIEQLSQMEGETYFVESTAQTDIENIETNKDVKTKTKFVFTGTVKSKGKQITKYIQEVDFYRNGNEYYGLYRISDVKNALKTPILIYNETNKGLSFIPGAAQFNKGENKKGTMFIVGELTFITGIVVSQILYSKNDNDYATYIKKGDLKNADISKQNRDNIGIVRSVCIIGAAGLYVYNVIDGFLTKGKPQYASRNIKFYPNLAYNNVGLSLTLTLK